MNKLGDITTLMQFSETWQKEADITWNVYRWACIFGDAISIVICLIVFVIIFCVRRRKEAALILIPVCFFFSCIFDVLRVVFK